MLSPLPVCAFMTCYRENFTFLGSKKEIKKERKKERKRETNQKLSV
jgi:hypothetical protein